MFWNYVKIALRNLRKNKVFAAINISGLSIGLIIYVFGGLLVEYEATHDLFFEKAERTYTIGSIAAPELNVGIDRFDSTFSALGPILETELRDVDTVARTIRQEYLLSMGEESFYEGVIFADPALTSIFDFDYIQGNEAALEDPSALIITRSLAIKYFGETGVVGRVVTFDNEFDFHVAAVIEDLPLNTHFNSSPVLDGQLSIIVPVTGLNRMRDWDLAGNWHNLSLGDMTYVVLPEALDGDWLQAQLDSIYERLVPDEQKDVIQAFTVSELSYANLALWDMIGMPVITVISLLSLMVLVVACINYTNLATAQSLGRGREVGMRKTMGASQRQLLVQFLIESLVIATIAMIVAVAVLEMIIPLFNSATNKSLTLNYVATLPWLLLTTALVGTLAGLYPAWLITRATPIDALRDGGRKGKSGSAMRSFMIGGQFAMSAFMLALVAVVYMQNERVKESSYVFPRSEIYTIDRLFVEGITDRLDTLRHELEALPNVDSVSYSSQVPYEQSNSSSSFSMQPGDEAGEFSLQHLSLSPEFLDTYDIPVLVGRGLNRDVANDRYDDADGQQETVNVLINELAVRKLGFASPEAAINQRFYQNRGDDDEEQRAVEHIIVGVLPTQNIVGLFNEEKPFLFRYVPEDFRIGSIRITGGNMMDTIESIEDTWDSVIPEYPMQGRFLDEVFDDVYNVLKLMNAALAGFAAVALALALIGLFGLAAFMAAQRTKEIGVRKVLGASTTQIARLLVWQFSTPVLWALALALPAAFFASNMYLDFFADRIEAPVFILLAAGTIAVLLAWGTVAGHAIRIARSSPILALRYE